MIRQLRFSRATQVVALDISAAYRCVGQWFLSIGAAVVLLVLSVAVAFAPAIAHASVLWLDALALALVAGGALFCWGLREIGHARHLERVLAQAGAGS